MGGHRASGAGDDLVDGPVDLAAVRADDALLDALAGGYGPPGAYDGGFGGGQGFGVGQGDDDRLAAVLAAWRADIEADPMPELVTVDEAMDAVSAGHEARDRIGSRSRRRMPFAIAAAACVVAFAGLTVAVHGAMPGDSLWGVSKVFFSERAASVQKVEDVRRSIDAANEAIARGDVATAREQLQQADIALPQIQAPEAKAPLQQQRDEARSSLAPQAPDEQQAAPDDPSSDPSTPDREQPPAAGGAASSPEATTTATPSAPEATSPDGTTPPAGGPTEPKSAPAGPPAPATSTTTPTQGISSTSPSN